MSTLKFKIYILHIVLNFCGTEEQNIPQRVPQRSAYYSAVPNSDTAF